MKPHTKEYRDIHPSNMSVKTTHAEASGAFGAVYRLVHKTAGYECAGSCARYTDAAWGAIATSAMDGTMFGQWYKTEAEARTHFDRVTTPIVEQHV